MWWNDGWWGCYGAMPGMFFGPVMFVVFVALCAAVVYLLVRGPGIGRRDDRAIDILKERYARGEIDQTEFEERRRSLQA